MSANEQFGCRYGDGVNPDAVLGFLILLISYVWKVGGISSKACAAYRRSIRHPLQFAFESLLAYTAKRCLPTHSGRSSASLLWLIAYRLVLAVWIPYFAVFETLASFSSAMWISALGLVFGTIQIAIPHQQNEELLGPNENVWGFGQLVPLILLIQPLSAVWEVLVVDSSLIREEQLYPTHTSDDVQQEYMPTSKHATENSGALPTTLLQYFADSKPMKPAERETNSITVAEQILFGSRLFYINVYLIQPAIIAAATIAYWNDANLIGYSTTGNWSDFCIVLSVYVGVAWIVTFCLTPWDITGRKPKDCRESHGAVVEKAEEGGYVGG